MPCILSPTKRIAIVGGGTAGIAALRALLDLPEAARVGWEVELFEQKDDLGGLWIPDDAPAGPPALPQTPLYPAMRTNNPHPQMTFPHDPFPAGTNLFPPHAVVREHLVAFADKHGLRQFVKFSHEVLEARYEAGVGWTVDLRSDGGAPFSRSFDHLIVANGHNRHPSQPVFEGVESWVGPGRAVIHSTYYRDPAPYKDQIVVVVGNGATGRDEAFQLSKHGAKVYHSYTTNRTGWAALENVVLKPRISHFTSDSIVFTDGSVIASSLPITVFCGTGYELRVPFLPALSISPELSPSSTSLELMTNLRLIGPLYQHVFPLDPRFPQGTLAFVGLGVNVSYCALAYIQGLTIAHALVDPERVLPPPEEALADLRAEQAKLRAAGVEPLVSGHRFPLSGSNEDYQDSLLDLLRTRSATALPSFLHHTKPYVEPWRRTLKANFLFVKTAWELAEEKGVEGQFLRGDGSEEAWEKAVQDLREWGRANGVV